MLSSRTVFDETHDKAITFLSLDHNCRDFCLTELNESLNSPLATNKIIACSIRIGFSRAHRDRALEADFGDALNDFLKIPPISKSRIQEANLVNRNGLNLFQSCRFRAAHATSWNEVRAAIE